MLTIPYLTFIDVVDKIFFSLHLIHSQIGENLIGETLELRIFAPNGVSSEIVTALIYKENEENTSDINSLNIQKKELCSMNHISKKNNIV